MWNVWLFPAAGGAGLLAGSVAGQRHGMWADQDLSLRVSVEWGTILHQAVCC